MLASWVQARPEIQQQALHLITNIHCLVDDLLCYIIQQGSLMTTSSKEVSSLHAQYSIYQNLAVPVSQGTTETI